MAVQEIIVYRNPAEAALWNLFSESAYTFPIIVAVIVFFVVLGMLPNKVSQKNGYVALTLAAIPAILVFYLMLV